MPLRSKRFLAGLVLFGLATLSFFCGVTESFTGSSNCNSIHRRSCGSKLVLASSTQEEAKIASLGNNDDEDDENDSDDDSDLLSSSTLQNGYFGSNSNGYSMTSGYSRFLYTKDQKKPRWFRRNRFVSSNNDNDMNEDGYADMQQRERNRSPWNKLLRLPFKVAKKLLPRETKEPGTLILVRHGESEWNKNKTFTGWADPDLTEQGKREVEHAGRLLMEGGYHYDIHVVFTSRLKRYVESCARAMVSRFEGSLSHSLQATKQLTHSRQTN